jgi:predicted aspartyl protease
MPNLIINGSFVPLFSGSLDDNVLSPMIKVSIVAPRWDKKTPDISNMLAAQDVNALIDTGAAYCLITHRLANSLALPIFRGGNATNFDDKIETHSYETSIYIKEISKVTTIEAVGRELQESSFDIILGWNFLSHYTLWISKKANIVRLEWVGT